jgi:hypothetical protein
LPEPLDEPDEPEPDDVEVLAGVDELEESDEPADFDDESPPDFVGDSEPEEPDEPDESVAPEEPPDEPELEPLRLSVL